MGDVLPLVQDLSSIRLIQPQDGAPHGGFSAAGFPHQPQSRSFFYGKTDVIHCMEIIFLIERLLKKLNLASRLEIFFQIFDFQKYLCHDFPP